MEDKKAYYNIITEIWKSFKADLTLVAEIKDPQDARWVALCDRYDKIYEDAPDAVKSYAFGMVQMHVAELEKRWRWRH